MNRFFKSSLSVLSDASEAEQMGFLMMYSLIIYCTRRNTLFEQIELARVLRVVDWKFNTSVTLENIESQARKAVNDPTHFAQYIADIGSKITSESTIDAFLSICSDMTDDMRGTTEHVKFMTMLQDQLHMLCRENRRIS